MNWTNPSAHISPKLVEQMFPEQANCVVAGFSIHKGYQVFRLQFVVQAKVTAIDCVSLFTGVAGLELGLRGISWLVFM